MKPSTLIAALILSAQAFSGHACPPLLNHTLANIDGTPQSLCAYHGKVVLVVNTASDCGYTHQYKGLQAIHDKYGKQGFVVLGFPSNDFGGQEPGSNAAIKNFCEVNYDVDFPLFSKVRLVAGHANPLHEGLARATGVRPAWNFHKYLIDRSGLRVQSFPSMVEPESPELVGSIERLLKARSGNHKFTQVGP